MSGSYLDGKVVFRCLQDIPANTSERRILCPCFIQPSLLPTRPKPKHNLFSSFLADHSVYRAGRILYRVLVGEERSHVSTIRTDNDTVLPEIVVVSAICTRALTPCAGSLGLYDNGSRNSGIRRKGTQLSDTAPLINSIMFIRYLYRALDMTPIMDSLCK